MRMVVTITVGEGVSQKAILSKNDSAIWSGSWTRIEVVDLILESAVRGCEDDAGISLIDVDAMRQALAFFGSTRPSSERWKITLHYYSSSLLIPITLISVAVGRKRLILNDMDADMALLLRKM
jgi:hypothetical protein